MKGTAITYTQAELDWIKTNSTRPRKDAHVDFQTLWQRKDVSLSNFNSLCKRNGWLTGRTGHYAKGRTPENKGKKMPFNPNSASTQFKKGHAPSNRLPMWSERTDNDGYIEMKVRLANPHTGHKTRFMHKHKYLWEQANGPLPDGMCLKCLDGNRTNCDPSNWEAIPRALLPRLSGRWNQGYDDAEPEVKPALLATAKLDHAIREIKKGAGNEQP